VVPPEARAVPDCPRSEPGFAVGHYLAGLAREATTDSIDAHPAFDVVIGAIERWERPLRSSPARRRTETQPFAPPCPGTAQ